jgi:cytochrome c-type biogenesis protein CcmH/NrfG
VEAGLMISSVPPQADVLINGQLRGVTPVTLQLSPGRYNITVRKQGYQDQTQPVQVEAEKLLSLNVPLVPARAQGAQPAPATQAPAQQPAGKGWIEVRTIPPGADILINNASTGRKTPARIELAPGTYTLTIFARGYQVLQKQIQVEAEKTLTVNEALSRQ